MAVKFSLAMEDPITFRKIEDNARDWKPVLKRWTGFLKSQSKKKYDSLAPLAQSTLRKYAHTRTSKVTKAGRVRVSYARNLKRALKRQGKDGGASLIATLSQLRAGDLDVSTFQSKALGRLQRALVKAQTGKVVGGNKRKIQGHKILGKLIGALVGSINGDTARVENAARYSKVINEGGTVGNGAVLPARTTLSIEQSDTRVLGEIVVDHMLNGSKR